MTSTEIRQSFLDFFKSKQHTIVPSSSLLPDSPNLLFTNAGMNQFVPIFLGQQKPPFNPPRAADTQKCIRAGGKHNDLEDVGLDTYHHTFFEMLGNWSFGDYFKEEAIEWAWELVTGIWKFPKNRLYATVYKPGPGEPSEFDQEACDHWARLFTAAGLDPKVHIVHGGKKDNFWMMGETGPCGPCSEIHVDLTPDGNTQGALVNKGDARCIEIWNLVFIQFNANPDATFTPLPARHVDTGMGFERVTSIIQGTKNFTDFKNAKISNYETDIFRPIFDAIEKLSGRKYTSTLPKPGSTGDTEQEKTDVAFRVIADHIRTLSFAIADGIRPGNTDRNYVLRRILRRAVRYGRSLGFHEPFFYKLVDVLAATMGQVFPEIITRKQSVQDTIRIEEEAFNKTLDKGLDIFREYAVAPEEAEQRLRRRLTKRRDILASGFQIPNSLNGDVLSNDQIDELVKKKPTTRQGVFEIVGRRAKLNPSQNDEVWRDIARHIQIQVDQTPGFITGKQAFTLYDTYGFPLDLTELMAREHGIAVDTSNFETFMEEQRARARAAQKKEVIELSQIQTKTDTTFLGYDALSTTAKVIEIFNVKGKSAVVLDNTVAYAEAGGQVGDTGELRHGSQLWPIVNTLRSGNTWLHFINEGDAPFSDLEVEISIDRDRRRKIERHHTVTHLLHWALHEVVDKDATQKGSFVGPEKLTFDFNSQPLTSQQLWEVEKAVNDRILENERVSASQARYTEIKNRTDIMQFFGEKYGEMVRVVQIGGKPGALDGYSMELCGGTHIRSTGEIGLFRVLSENAIASGIRRIEAVAGEIAYEHTRKQQQVITGVAKIVNAPVQELEKKVEALLAQQKDLEKQLKAAQQRDAVSKARELWNADMTARMINQIPIIAQNFGAASGDYLQSIADALKQIGFKGVVVLGGCADGAVSLVATVSPEFTAKIQAGKIIQTIAPIVGGKGGGRPDNARGGGRDASKLNEALTKASEILKSLG